MMPPDPKDDLATEWLNTYLGKLRYSQDYFLYQGASKPMMEDGKQIGLSIVRPNIRLYSTGITKLYEMIVEGKEMPDVEYTEAEEEQFDKDYQERYPDEV